MEKHERKAIDICKMASYSSLDEIQQAYDNIETQYKEEARSIIASVIFLTTKKETADKIINLLSYGQK